MWRAKILFVACLLGMLGCGSSSRRNAARAAEEVAAAVAVAAIAAAVSSPPKVEGDSAEDRCSASHREIDKEDDEACRVAEEKKQRAEEERFRKQEERLRIKEERGSGVVDYPVL